MPENINCPYMYSDMECEDCEMYCDGECGQDEDLGGTGHGDISFSDADPGL